MCRRFPRWLSHTLLRNYDINTTGITYTYKFKALGHFVIKPMLLGVKRLQISPQCGIFSLELALQKGKKKKQCTFLFATLTGITCVTLRHLRCVKWETADSPKTNLEYTGRRTETERDVSSSWFKFCSWLLSFLHCSCSSLLQLSDVSYTPNLHWVLKNYP